MMNINDRGTRKWTTMMLPEQAEKLNQLEEIRNRKKKPILDEQKQEENNFQLMLAHKDHLLIEIKYFKDYDFHYEKGYIDNINYLDKYIRIVEKLSHNDFVKIKFDSILDVFIL